MGEKSDQTKLKTFNFRLDIKTNFIRTVQRDQVQQGRRGALELRVVQHGPGVRGRHQEDTLRRKRHQDRTGARLRQQQELHGRHGQHQEGIGENGHVAHRR